MSDFTKKATIAVTGLAVGALAFWLLQAVFQTGGEDDQPPVVVSSGGSAIFEVQDNGQGHGMWTPNGDKQITYDGKGNGNVPKNFTVRLYNVADSQPTECGKSFKNVLALQGTLDTGSQFNVSITGAAPDRHLTIDATTNGADDKFTVSGYVAHYAASAAILKNVLVNGVSCDLKPTGRFIVVQLH